MRDKRKYLFARMSRISPHPVYVEVEAYDKDHAVKRLVNAYPYTDRTDWDFLDELDPDHFIGRMGAALPLNEIYPGAKKATVVN